MRKRGTGEPREGAQGRAGPGLLREVHSHRPHTKRGLGAAREPPPDPEGYHGQANLAKGLNFSLPLPTGTLRM